MAIEFAVFILTHGRADAVVTDKTLRGSGYTGPIFYVCDDEDQQLERYRSRYGEAVHAFCKKDYADSVDEGDNFDNRRTTTHVRNAIFDIAQRLQVEAFVVMDDDYTTFTFRTDTRGMYPQSRWKCRTQLDAVFLAFVKYLRASGADSIAFAQGGDYIGGDRCGFAIDTTPRRKGMNSFFFLAGCPVRFLSRVNEDVNSVLAAGYRGSLFLTIPLFSLDQLQTQSNPGGMTETYRIDGTFQKSFSSVMFAPYAVRVSMMGRTDRRIHHKINWRSAVPVIIREEWRKLNDGRTSGAVTDEPDGDRVARPEGVGFAGLSAGSSAGGASQDLALGKRPRQNRGGSRSGRDRKAGKRAAGKTGAGRSSASAHGHANSNGGES